MSKMNLRFGLAVLAAIAFTVTASAQHGRPAGGGPGAAGGMGAPSGMSAGHAAMGMGDANPGKGRPSLSSAHPGTALSNPKLDSSLTAALGHSGIAVPGGNLQSACQGFKNLGQCVAALHVSKNLGIPFSDLQAKMTGANRENLGKAILDLGSANMNAKAEAKKGSKQANADLDAAAAESQS